MKVRACEWERCFFMIFEPETMEEVGLLVRMGALSRTVDGQKMSATHVHKKGAVTSTLYLPKRKGDVTL